MLTLGFCLLVYRGLLKIYNDNNLIITIIEDLNFKSFKKGELD